MPRSGEELGAGKDRSGDLSPSSIVRTNDLSFSLHSGPASRQAAGTKRETPVGGGRKVGALADAPLPPRPPSLTYLSGSTGTVSLGRAGPALPPESTGRRAVGSGGSVLAESLSPLPPSLLTYTHPTPPSLSSSRPTLGALLAACISEPLQPRLPWALTLRFGSVSRSLGPPNSDSLPTMHREAGGASCH